MDQILLADNQTKDLYGNPIVTEKQDTGVQENTTLNNILENQNKQVDTMQPQLANATQTSYQAYVEQVQHNMDAKKENKRKVREHPKNKTIKEKIFGVADKKSLVTERDIYKKARDTTRTKFDSNAVSTMNLVDTALADFNRLDAVKAPDNILLLMNDIICQVDKKTNNFDELKGKMADCRSSLKIGGDAEPAATCEAILKRWEAYYANLAPGKLEAGAESKDLSLGGYTYKPTTIIACDDNEFAMDKYHDRRTEEKKRALRKRTAYDKTYKVAVEETDRKAGDKTASNERAPLFTHAPDMNDTKQGGVGDCYFIAALASKAKSDPESIMNMIRDNNDGSVTVRFYRKVDAQQKLDSLRASNRLPTNKVEPLVDKTIFEPIYVTVKKSTFKVIESGTDANGKYIADDKKDLFARDVLWVQLVEKAYAASGLNAEAHGKELKKPSYDSIAGGRAAYVMEHLSGKSPITNEKVAGGDGLKLFSNKTITGNIANSVLTSEQRKDKKKAAKEIVPELTKKIKQKMGKETASAEKLASQLFGLIASTDENRLKEVTLEADASIKRYQKGIPTMHNMVKMVLTSEIGENAEDRKNLAALLVEIVSKSTDSGMQYASFSGVYREEAERVYEKIRQGQEQNSMMNANSTVFKPEGVVASGLNGENVAKGIHEMHMYTILGIHEEKEAASVGNKEKIIKFITIRNPWGRGIGTYQRHDDGSIKHSVADGKSQAAQESNGVMIMELNEFMSKFDKVTIG